MYDFRNFDDVFEFDTNYSFDQKDVEDIESFRRELEGLFIDKVLKLLDIKRPAKQYPPKTNADLRNLHHLVVESTTAEQAKLSVLYYLLLDSAYQDQEEFEANKFAEQTCLPKKNQIFMKGLWHMDRKEFELALQYLTHPSLIPTFHEEILEALVRGATKNDYSLALSYFYTVQPTITNPQTLDSLFMAITQTSASEAFFFLKGQADSTRQIMFESLISHVLSGPANERTADRAVELVNLPFNDEEEEWFEQYLTTGGGRQHKKAIDTVMMRKIAIGKYKDVSKLGGSDGRPNNGLSWDKVQIGLENGLGPRLR